MKLGNISKKLIGFMTAICIIMVTFGLSGCGEGSQGKSFLVYYVNSTADDILHKDYSMPGAAVKDMEQQAGELIHQMFEVDYSDDGYISAKPAEVSVNKFKIDENGLITVDFSSEYLDISNVREITLRSSLVLTLIQIDGVVGVEITVDGDAIRYTSGAEVGVMSADDFVNILLTEDGMLKQETEVVLFFANEDGTALVPITSHLTITNNSSSIEEYIVAQLIAGPAADTGAKPTLASDVKLLNVTTTDKVCYVNFESTFLEQEQPVSDEILIYSIVNSLCKLRYVSSVQFLIDGEVVDTMHKITDISKPFTRNRSLETSN